MSKYDIPVIFVLIFYPILIITLVINYVFSYPITFFEIFLFTGGYYISNVTVGVGLHRLWSHNSYKVNKIVEFILVLLSSGTLQGPVLSWVSNHFRHHIYTDTKLDPHSSIKYENRVKSFLWSHIGWMLKKKSSHKLIDKITMIKLGKNRLLRWQLKHYWLIALFMNTFIPAFVGYIYTKSLLGAYTGFLFIGLGRALQQQITFLVNSLCHFTGKKTYIQGTSGDIWWLALFLLGENWHNYHHAFPSDYRNGVNWYQLDIHKWIIYLMSKCGLAWDLKRTEKSRVKARVLQTAQYYIELKKDKLELMNKKIAELTSDLHKRIAEIEKSKIGQKFINSLFRLLNNLSNITQQLNQQLKDLKNPSEKIISIISKKIKRTENAYYKLYSQLEIKKKVNC